MTPVALSGYPDYVGRRFTFVGLGAGPSSYSQTTKDVVTLPGFQNYIDQMVGSTSVSGTYLVRAQPVTGGARSVWRFTWIVVATGLEVANAVNLSAEKVQVMALGGRY